jgi:hypothetical protein
MTVKPVHQQSLEATMGLEKALQACLPACFYMLAKAYGYLPGLPFEDFSESIDWAGDRTQDGSWMRPKLSADLRRRYHLPIVSWWINAPRPMSETDYARMKSSGYVSSQRELAWFEANAHDWPIEVIVAAGTPVIVTMKPGFGSNRSVHAVILASLKDDRYEIIDPDARNRKRFYSIDEIRRNMSPQGAASVVLAAK